MVESDEDNLKGGKSSDEYNFNQKDSFGEDVNSEQERKESIIKYKTLELIAKEISYHCKLVDLERLLINCGVNSEVISEMEDLLGLGTNLLIYEDLPRNDPRKWKMLISFLWNFATSPDTQDHNLLFKIIEEASHPLMFDGNEESANNFEERINSLLKYDGFILKKGKIKRIKKETNIDPDLELYLRKKILLEKWRDGAPFPLYQLSFSNNSLEQICYILLNLYSTNVITFGPNTFPEDILIEADPLLKQDFVFNWNLIKDLDINPRKIENEYGFDIEILNEEWLKKSIKKEIDEFISNKVKPGEIKKMKEFVPDTEYLKTPLYLRGEPHNYYSYKKQREILLTYIASLYEELENELVVIKFEEIKDPSINILRTLLALEEEKILNIKEINNERAEWTEKDSIYARIEIDRSKIQEIKKFLTTKKTKEEEKISTGEMPSKEKESFPVKISGEVKVKIDDLEKEDKSKVKFPYELPAGTEWEEVSIKFLDNENITIKVRQFEHKTDFKEMEFTGKGKNPNPSEAWKFLRVLAENSGEISAKDYEKYEYKYKKQKEILAKKLKSYFSIDYDPFYRYHSSPEKKGNSYKIKITLTPPPPTENENDSFSEEENIADLM